MPEISHSSTFRGRSHRAALIAGIFGVFGAFLGGTALAGWTSPAMAAMVVEPIHAASAPIQTVIPAQTGQKTAGPVVQVAQNAANGHELVPHQAEYSFSMTSSEAGSSIVAAHGVLGYRFEKVCDGWVTEMQQLMSLQGTEGAPINSGYSITQWESFDGDRYRFRIRDFLDGTKVDEVIGQAIREQDKVSVTYEAPVEVTDELPSETLFPTQHTRQLLEHARSGQKFTSDLVFDGSGDMPTNRIAAVISGLKQARAANGAIAPAIPGKVPGSAPATAPGTGDGAGNIANTPFYSINLAYYPLGGAENGPSTEIAVDFGDNGVAHELRINYGSFTVTGTLQKVSPIELPVCE